VSCFSAALVIVSIKESEISRVLFLFFHNKTPLRKQQAKKKMATATAGQESFWKPWTWTWGGQKKLELPAVAPLSRLKDLDTKHNCDCFVTDMLYTRGWFRVQCHKRASSSTSPNNNNNNNNIDKEKPLEDWFVMVGRNAGNQHMSPWNYHWNKAGRGEPDERLFRGEPDHVTFPKGDAKKSLLWKDVTAEYVEQVRAKHQKELRVQREQELRAQQVRQMVQAEEEVKRAHKRVQEAEEMHGALKKKSSTTP
jgi:hypothetical protein